jgi:integrase
MATFTKRNGKHHVQIRRRGFPTTCRTFELKSDALEWAREMERRADRGELPASRKELAKIKLSDILVRYRDEVTIEKLSANSEIYLINAVLRSPMSNLLMCNLTVSHFHSYREKRLKKVKNGTVNRELGIIKHAIDTAKKEWGVPILTNPLDDLKKLKVQNSRSRRLTETEYELIQHHLAVTRNSELKDLIDLAIETGMRRGEILKMEWEDVQFETATLFIPTSKNGHSRMIPLTPKAVSLLVRLKSLPKRDTPFSISDNAAKLLWQRLIKRTGIDNLHFHDLRHEAISRFFEFGLSVPEVALISGHRDFRMLFRYTHMNAGNIARKLSAACKVSH